MRIRSNNKHRFKKMPLQYFQNDNFATEILEMKDAHKKCEDLNATKTFFALEEKVNVIQSSRNEEKQQQKKKNGGKSEWQ